MNASREGYFEQILVLNFFKKIRTIFFFSKYIASLSDAILVLNMCLYMTVGKYELLLHANILVFQRILYVISMQWSSF